jgi:hypothetical protein
MVPFSKDIDEVKRVSTENPGKQWPFGFVRSEHRLPEVQERARTRKNRLVAVTRTLRVGRTRYR